MKQGTSGTYGSESLPNIKGSFFASSTVGFRDVNSGAFVCDLTTELSNYISPSTAYKGYPLKFDASRSSSAYQNNAKVNPDNAEIMYCIKF